MYKLVLILVLSALTQSEAFSNHNTSEAEELQDWVYWNAFSETFNQTADFWKSESAALEAESKAKDIVESEEWLSKIEQKEITKKHNHHF